MRRINIGIDGPAGSGKGTVAKIVAKELGYKYIDTGVMYRLLTFIILKNNIDANDDQMIKYCLINEFEYNVDGDCVYFNGKDVSKEIRSAGVNEIVSVVAGKNYVRKYMIDIQKKIASNKGVVMDGRDITSVVLKDAELKIYLDASFEVRVKRRYQEEIKKNMNTTIEEVRELMKNRDYKDIVVNKTLVKNDDCIVVDTSYTTVEEAVSKVMDLAREMINND